MPCRPSLGEQPEPDFRPRGGRYGELDRTVGPVKVRLCDHAPHAAGRTTIPTRQALGVASAQKYQSEGGTKAADIVRLLGGSDDPSNDQMDFLASQIIFWLIGATDGHAKNFSVFLRPGGGLKLTPMYDVLSVQTAKRYRASIAASLSAGSLEWMGSRGFNMLLP